MWVVGELAGDGLWLCLLAVGCLHLKGTSTEVQLPPPQHFHGTSTAPKNIYTIQQKCIGAFIRNGQDIQCLPYAGFFFQLFTNTVSEGTTC